MKKVLAIVLAAMMVVAMCAACGDSAQTTTAAETTVAETTAAETTAAPATTAAETTAAAGDEEAPPETPAGDTSGGEASGEVPASGTSVNSAHGQQTADEAGYKLYLEEWLKAEQSVNSTLTDANLEEFLALIEKGDYTTFPCDMLYSGMLTTGAAMTLEEFIAAGGVY